MARSGDTSPKELTGEGEETRTQVNGVDLSTPSQEPETDNVDVVNAPDELSNEDETSQETNELTERIGKLTVDELKELLDRNEIDYSGKTKKAEYVELAQTEIPAEDIELFLTEKGK